MIGNLKIVVLLALSSGFAVTVSCQASETKAEHMIRAMFHNLEGYRGAQRTSIGRLCDLFEKVAMVELDGFSTKERENFWVAMTRTFSIQTSRSKFLSKKLIANWDLSRDRYSSFVATLLVRSMGRAIEYSTPEVYEQIALALEPQVLTVDGRLTGEVARGLLTDAIQDPERATTVALGLALARHRLALPGAKTALVSPVTIDQLAENLNLEICSLDLSGRYKPGVAERWRTRVMALLERLGF